MKNILNAIITLIIFTCCVFVPFQQKTKGTQYKLNEDNYIPRLKPGVFAVFGIREIPPEAFKLTGALGHDYHFSRNGKVTKYYINSQAKITRVDQFEISSQQVATIDSLFRKTDIKNLGIRINPHTKANRMENIPSIIFGYKADKDTKFTFAITQIADPPQDEFYGNGYYELAGGIHDILFKHEETIPE